MKKKHLASLIALVFSAGVAGTSFAATDSFSDVPKDHWAYAAIQTLVKNKVIEGFDDDTFRGDRPLTRFEMALIVENALDKAEKGDALSKAAINKLKQEFAPELKNLGARVDKVEKKVDKIEKQIGGSSLYGDIKAYYGKNEYLEGNNGTGKNAGRWVNRTRLGVRTKIDENWSFNGRFGSQNTTGSNKLAPSTYSEFTSVNGEFFFDRAEVKYVPTTNKNWSYSFGRSYLRTSHGFVEDFTFDGLTAVYKNDKLRAKVMLGDQSPTLSLWAQNIGGLRKGTLTGTTPATYASKGAYQDTSYTWWGDFEYKLTKNANLTATGIKNISRTMPFNLLGVGADIKMGDFKLTTDYTKNRFDFDAIGDTKADTQRYGYWWKLGYKGAESKVPGTWGMNLTYMRVGTASIDATTLNFMNWSYGLKGWETSYEYTFAKGAKLSLIYGDFEPIDTSKFTSYNPAYMAELRFAF